MDVSGMRWRKSSYSSGNGGDCVEVAASAGVVAIRDTKDWARGMLRVPASEWHRFLGTLEQGDLDN
ncbi:DUF397 domain-containing protein [Sphaerisporangium aureirubrum]|uniref:DUF397 domain-containing protein n=1 Tax=Sphaerisporangium aureirubrum TaxID=1544736 RepID=A0ABW1NPI6_9ACTN